MRDISTFPFFLGRSVFLSSSVSSSKGVEQQKQKQKNFLIEKKYFAKSRKRQSHYSFNILLFTAIIELTTKHPFISSFFFFFFFHVYIGQRW